VKRRPYRHVIGDERQLVKKHGMKRSEDVGIKEGEGIKVDVDRSLKYLNFGVT
jgi:hypothetical protein